MTGRTTGDYTNPTPVCFFITRANTRFSPTPVLRRILDWINGRSRYKRYLKQHSGWHVQTMSLYVLIVRVQPERCGYRVGWIKALVFTPNPRILFPEKADSLSLNPPYRKLYNQGKMYFTS